MGTFEAIAIGIVAGLCIGMLARPLIVSLGAKVAEIFTTCGENIAERLKDRYEKPGQESLCHECPYRKWVNEQPGVPDFVMEEQTNENQDCN